MIRFAVKSDLEYGVRVLRRFPKLLGSSVRALVFRIETRLVREIKRRVHVVTGQLRRSWIARKPEKWGPHPTQWKGTISSSAPYAAMEEFGFSGAQPVKTHQRKTRGGGTVTVTGFTRQVSRPPHYYVRPSITFVEYDVPAMVEEAVIGAWRKAKDRGLLESGPIVVESE